MDKENSLLKIDGKIQEKTPGNILNMVFSADSRRFAYTLKEKDKYYIVVDGVKSKGYVALRPLIISGDSSNYAFVAKKGKKYVCVINGKEGPAYDEIGAFIFGGDSSRHAYLAQDGEAWKVVVDGRPGASYKLVAYPAFSPDSSHIAYIATKEVNGKTTSILVVDNQEGKMTFAGFMLNGYIVFDTPSSFHTIFSEPDNKIMRVDVEIK